MANGSLPGLGLENRRHEADALEAVELLALGVGQRPIAGLFRHGVDAIDIVRGKYWAGGEYRRLAPCRPHAIALGTTREESPTGLAPVVYWFGN